MHTRFRRFFSARKERTIAVTRLVLAASGLLAIWLDPIAPARLFTQAYSLHAAYIVYAIGLAVVMWNRDSSGRLPIATHVIDFVMFSILQYLTLGPTSPFFIYYIFSIFCAALRWDWRAVTATFAAVIVAYLSMALVMSRAADFDLSTFLVRTVTRVVTGGLIVYLAQYEMFLRSEIERLARWPTVGGLDSSEAISSVLAHAAGLLSADRALIAWDVAEEPRLHIAVWSPGSGLQLTRHAPGAFEPLVPAPLADTSFLCSEPLTNSAMVVTSDRGAPRKWRGLPVNPALVELLEGGGVASAPFQTARIAGRAFFSRLDSPSADLLPVTEVVARELGTLLDQQQWSERLRDIAVREQRISLARDLHDGVLQSLTGVRLELQSAATGLDGNADVRDRLLSLERALAIEQRELRLFIDQTRPSAPAGLQLVGRLESLRERVALEWKIPVSIRVTPDTMVLPEPLHQAVPLMAHEAIVNALKHAQPSRISIDVRSDNGSVHMVVTDDGRGFPFEGRYDHAALAKMNLGPASLRDRAASLGGEMSIESSKGGSRVEINVPLAGAA